MDQQDSRSNRRGLVSRGIDLANGAGNISTAIKAARGVTAIFSPWPLIIAGGVCAIVFLATLITTSGTGVALFPTGGGGAPVSASPIPGFKIDINADKTQAAVNDQLTYTITYSYSPSSGSSIQLGDITVYDALPSTVSFQDASGTKAYDAASNTVSWKLSDSGNTGPFSVTVTINSDNVRIVNSAYATSTASTLAIAPPGSGAQSSNACTQPHEGTGYCSYGNLLPYFNNDPQAALTSSLICNLESGSDPFSKNPICPDYSIGLFQINLIAHCGGAFTPAPACTLLDATLRDACEQRFVDPVENIRYAYQLYQNRQDWTAWSTYPAAQATLDACGNI